MYILHAFVYVHDLFDYLYLNYNFRPRLITLASTLIIPDIAKQNCFMEIYKNYCVKCKLMLFVLLKIQGQMHQVAELKTI